MAAKLIFLLLCALFGAASAQQQRYSNISLGSSLTPLSVNSSSWSSPSGLYAFGFYKQGNGYLVGIFLAGIPEKTVVWTANRDRPPVPGNVTLLLTTDGRLILQQGQGQDTDVISPSDSISSASMLDSGNFVLYSSNQMIIWQSFENPTDTLVPGQRLLNGKELISGASDTDHSKGIFRLSMQTDGNLVQYPVSTPATATYAYYATSTDGLGSNVTLNLDRDGSLYLWNSSSVVRNLTRGGFQEENTVYRMRIDPDGILRLYSHPVNIRQGNWSIKWNSTNDKCNPKGICGLNGFCILSDLEMECRCLPGFDFVDPGNWKLGCQRNFTAEGCKANDLMLKYGMRAVENTVWENEAYEEEGLATREDCEKACLEDCNCEAALFDVRNCRKQRLPLRFGRRSPSSSVVALVKVGTSTFISDQGQGGDARPPKGSKKERLVLITGISLVSFAAILFAISCIIIYRNGNRAYRKLSDFRKDELIDDVGPRAFTFAELKQATNDFKEELGRGSFGTVYKGLLLNGQKIIAVKRLEKVLAEGEIEFRTEMKVIGKTHHRNLVRLLGYCLDGSNRLLVYEYMSNGSLADTLFRSESSPPCWEERLRFALDIARGILYLHEECETQIIHCDIKPQNILMDDQMCAKISDFGLAKLLKQDQTRTYTGIRGTKGYVAPEWHRKLPVTVKADVYSFGIVLLEIVCCRRSVDFSLPEDEAILEEWVYSCYQSGQLNSLVNEEEVDMRRFERMIKVGIWCIQDEPSLRPSMKKVLLMLEGTVDIPVPPSPTSFLSAI